MTKRNVETMRVSADSDCVKVASSMTKVFRNGNGVQVRVIGAGAVNVALKACIVAGQFMGGTARVIPAFDEQEIEGRVRTLIMLDVAIEEEDNPQQKTAI